MYVSSNLRPFYSSSLCQVLVSVLLFPCSYKSLCKKKKKKIRNTLQNTFLSPSIRLWRELKKGNKELQDKTAVCYINQRNFYSELPKF